MRMIGIRGLGALAAALLASAPATAAPVRLPAGTVVYGELGERVTSKKKETEVGDLVQAHVWRDVTVDGRVLVRAGTPMVARVSHVKKARFAGLKGQLEIEAVSVPAVDGTEILLDGGYDKSGHGRKALSISLAAVVAWPLIFIKGKQAVLDPGTVFDAEVQSDASITAGDAVPMRPIRLAGRSLSVQVLYDEMEQEGKSKSLPLRLEGCGIPLDEAGVSTVNGEAVERIPVLLGERLDGECPAVHGTVDLDRLGKHFRRGINRFEVTSGGLSSEVVLDIEL